MPRPTNTQLDAEAQYAKEGAKACRKCGQVLALSSFGNAAKNRDGLQANCKPCVNKRNRGYAARPGAKQVKREGQRKRRGRSPEKEREYNLRGYAKKYGLTVEEYQMMMDKPCAICDAPSEAMDHCHETGKTRAALCHRCNHGLGHFKDNPETLARAIFYLLSF